MHEPGPRGLRVPQLGLGEVDAVDEEGPAHEEPVPAQALDDARAAALPAVLDVGAVLGHVDVQARVGVPDRSGQAIEARVREREARVRTDHAEAEGGGSRRQEGTVLRDSGVPALDAVPVGRLVAEHRAEPDLLDRPAQRGERSRR